MEYNQLFLFKNLPQNQIEELNKLSFNIKTFNKGEVIYSKNNFSNAIGFILSGNAFAVSNNENKVYLTHFEKNMCFGAAAVFGGDNLYVSTVTAKTDTTVLFISEDELKNLFALYPQTAVNYITFLSQRVRFLNNKLNIISSTRAEDTLLNYLVSIIDQNNCAKIPKNMTLFSKALGLSRATLYRAINLLEEKGYISKENNIIKVIKNEENY